MDPEYLEKVKQWVEIDNKIVRIQDQIKSTLDAIVEHKDTRKSIEEDIISYVQQNKFEKLTLNINDGTIKFCRKTQNTPLSLKTLRNMLDKYSEEKNNLDINSLYEFIVGNLEKKTTFYMKRDICDDNN